ncbi:MAG: ATP synthase F1 subunit delta [Planctomycetaceae bacterium]|nr:ATP synthase F1 subunit delta [Planctomycetaceae bacterium]
MSAESRDITAEDARVAAQIEADVGVEHIAGVYAKALLDTVEKSGQTASALAEFDAIVADVLNPFPKLESVLASALISPDEKAAVLDRVLGGRVSPVMVHFLKVVARHGRLDCLRAIHREAHALDDERRRRIPVQLTTAAPISAAAVERIADSLRAKLGGEPIFQQQTDPALIGGAVLRVGDTVYDGSIANQLEILRQQMIEKSDHEIQSRRDRFRNPTGN